MVIKQYYSPKIAGELSGEELIFKRGLGGLFNEIRQSVLQNELKISNRKTAKKGKGATGNTGLADGMNKALAFSLESLGWSKRKAPGAKHIKAELDWYKDIPSTLSFGPKSIGVGLEVQFGNNYQFNEDIKRLFEHMLEGAIVAGVSIVPSDELAKFKADRGASFSDAKSKLDRELGVIVGAGAAIIPGFVLLGVSMDGFTGVADGKFTLVAPKFDGQTGVDLGPSGVADFGTAKAT